MVRLYEEYLTLANKLMEIMGHALKLDVCVTIIIVSCIEILAGHNFA